MSHIGTEYKLEKPVEETVLYDKVTPNIARVTFNRPEKHNAIYALEGFIEIRRKLAMAVDDDDVKVVIIRGNGPSFCTGDDLNRAPYEAFGGRPGFAPPQSKRLIGFQQIEGELVRDMIHHPKILITQAHGWVMGFGIMFVVCSDLAIAAESTRLAHYEQRISFGGLEPCAFPMTVLHIGPKRAREWAISGRAVLPQEAKEWGLVNSVVPDDKLEEETMRWAEMVTLQSADGLVLGKINAALCYESMGLSASILGGVTSHALMTNLRWRDDEFNFLKVRTKDGASQAFKQREERWRKLGF